MSARPPAQPVLLLTKTDGWSGHAAALARALWPGPVTVLAGRRGDPLPDALATAEGGLLLSFLSPWIVPAPVLQRSAHALNFHPGSADYPGIGCYNFALYEGAAAFGCVCHHMAPRVDTGAILYEERFPVLPADTVESLKLRTMTVMLALFHRVLTDLARGEALPTAGLAWRRRPFTRRELDALCRIDPAMPPEEIRRRVRAVTYPGYPGAVVELAGVPFAAPVPAGPPLA